MPLETIASLLEITKKIRDEHDAFTLSPDCLFVVYGFGFFFVCVFSIEKKCDLTTNQESMISLNLRMNNHYFAASSSQTNDSTKASNSLESIPTSSSSAEEDKALQMAKVVTDIFRLNWEKTISNGADCGPFRKTHKQLRQNAMKARLGDGGDLTSVEGWNNAANDVHDLVLREYCKFCVRLAERVLEPQHHALAAKLANELTKTPICASDKSHEIGGDVQELANELVCPNTVADEVNEEEVQEEVDDEVDEEVDEETESKQPISKVINNQGESDGDDSSEYPISPGYEVDMRDVVDNLWC